jgi:hypothetical protein
MLSLGLGVSQVGVLVSDLLDGASKGRVPKVVACRPPPAWTSSSNMPTYLDRHTTSRCSL